MTDRNHAEAIAAEVRRLATLRPIERDRELKAAAARFDCDKATLRRQVAAYAQKLARAEDSDDYDEAEPWAKPIADGAALLTELAHYIGRFIVTSPAAVDAAALWVVHTHCFRAFRCTPRYNIRGPTPGCGKSLFLEIIGSLVAKPDNSANITPAAVFRTVEQFGPTLLVDEVDTFLRDDAHEIRGILNSGFQPNGRVARVEDDGSGRFIVRRYRTFAPVALAGLRGLPATLHDRSIVVTLQKASPDEEPEDWDIDAKDAAITLKRKIARWATDNFDALRRERPTMPAEMRNRVRDKWRPLFAIAEVAGGNWPARAVASFRGLYGEELDKEDLGILLLRDLRELFLEKRGEVLHAGTIVGALNAREDSPWCYRHNGQGLNQNDLAWLLRAFKVSPQRFRVGGKQRRGYYRAADLEPVFVRYLEPLDAGDNLPEIEADDDAPAI
jgi:putative DNA primase/helicase